MKPIDLPVNELPLELLTTRVKPTSKTKRSSAKSSPSKKTAKKTTSSRTRTAWKAKTKKSVTAKKAAPAKTVAKTAAKKVAKKVVLAAKVTSAAKKAAPAKSPELVKRKALPVPRKAVPSARVAPVAKKAKTTKKAYQRPSRSKKAIAERAALQAALVTLAKPKPVKVVYKRSKLSLLQAKPASSPPVVSQPKLAHVKATVQAESFPSLRIPLRRRKLASPDLVSNKSAVTYVTCLNCGRVHFQRSRFEANEEIENFNEFFSHAPTSLYPLFGKEPDSIDSYERCFSCNGSYRCFRETEEEDTLVGKVITPIIDRFQ